MHRAQELGEGDKGGGPRAMKSMKSMKSMTMLTKVDGNRRAEATK
jgi:hypothetical protein